jgi:L-iditol 2-dehydrogenase
MKFMTEITTQALVLRGAERAGIERLTLPELGADEVLVGRLIGGVCGTDKAKWEGIEPVDGPVNLGHEFGGVIEAVGSEVTGWSRGDTVACWIRPGWPHGGFAERTIVRADWLVAVRRREHACFVEPFMCVGLAVRRSRPHLGPLAVEGRDPLEAYGYVPRERRWIAVIGTGTMSLAAVALSALEEPEELIVLGRSHSGLKRAKRLGATRVIDTSNRNTEEVIEELRSYTPDDRGVDVSYEGIGEQFALGWALMACRMGGEAFPLGFHQSEGGIRTVDMGHDLGWHAQGLGRGHSRDAETAKLPPREDEVMPACRLIAELFNRGVIDPSVLVGEIWPLSGGTAALRATTRRGAGKQLIDATL